MRGLSVFFAILIATQALGQNVITTIAGTDWLFPADGQPALNAPLGGVQVLGIAVDNQGNYFISDPDNIMVFKVSPDGILRVVAGNGILGISGDGGPATSASMIQPLDVAVDTAGNLYITDAGAFIRKVTPDGIITRIAGNSLNGGFAGEGVPATSATFGYAYGLTVDSSGTIFVADRTNNRVRRITPDGIVTTVAGNGFRGFSGDGGPATRASLNLPADVAVDAAGNLYITDDGNLRVRMVSPDGIISTVVGGGAADPAGGAPALGIKITPGGITVDPLGVLYVGDYVANRIVRVSDGVATTIAGNGKQELSGDGGPGVLAGLNRPTGVGVDDARNLYIADSDNHRVRRLDANGNIDTVAGNGGFRHSGEGGPSTSATLFRPASIAVDKAGNYYICETEQSRIQKVDTKGIITTIAGTGRQKYSGDGGPAVNADLLYPSGVAVDGAGTVYIADQGNGRVRRIAPNGIISTIAGNGNHALAGDGGPASSATLSAPQDLLVDAAGNLYISDYGNDTIRKVTPDGVIHAFAGTGQTGYNGDNMPATSAALNSPAGMALDAQGNLYFADAGNNRVRKVTPQGDISSVAGNGIGRYAGDGGPATRASLDNPTDVAVDAAGNLYIADLDNDRVREVTPNGVISTIAGAATQIFSGDGGPALDADITGPSALKFDPAGDLLIADYLNNRIRAILAAPPTFQSAPGALTFTAESGGLPAPAQSVQLAGSIPGLAFNVAIPSSAPWLQVTPAAGVMPANAQITADPTGLAPGVYQTTVNLVSPNTQPLLRPAAVTFTVNPARPARLGAKPDGLSFSLVQGAPAATQTITVSNQGGGSLDFTAVASAVSGGGWLGVSPAGGASTVSSSTTLQVTADPTGLAPGTYSGALTIASSTTGESVAIPAVMTVSSVQQTIRLLQTGLTFTAVAAGGVTPPQTFGVQNIGQGVMDWSASGFVLSGSANWLTVSPDSGSSGAAAADAPGVTVSVDPSGLAAGNYYGQVTVAAPGADNSPQTVSVALNVLPAGSDPGPIVQPTGLIFTGAAGDESPGSQIVTAANLNGAPLTFASGRTTVDGKDWFVHLPIAATLAPQQAARIVVQPKIEGLAPGLYRGTLTLLFSGGVSRTVSLLFVVTAAPAVSSPKPGRRAQGGCIPTQLAPIFTSLADSFSVAATWPSTVGVRVIDDCGNLMASGSAVATFSNGDPPQALQHSQSGDWSGTWQPRATTSAPVTITASAEIPELKLRGSAQVTGALRTNQNIPVITPGAVVSSASLIAQTPIAPGSLISILGSSLADTTLSSSTLPLPVGLAGTSVLIAGRAAPIVSVSDGRIDAVVPYDVPPNTQHQVIVQKGAVATLPEPVTVAPAQPAIFSKDKSGSGQGLVYAVLADGTQTLADSANPVAAGDTIVIQCAGLGAVDPALPAGGLVPDSPLSTAVNPVAVNIGGVDATVTFAGLAPGSTGIYVVEATVPDGVGAGSAVPLVLSAAGQVSPPVTMAVR